MNIDDDFPGRSSMQDSSYEPSLIFNADELQASTSSIAKSLRAHSDVATPSISYFPHRSRSSFAFILPNPISDHSETLVVTTSPTTDTTTITNTNNNKDGNNNKNGSLDLPILDRRIVYSSANDFLTCLELNGFNGIYNHPLTRLIFKKELNIFKRFILI